MFQADGRVVRPGEDDFRVDRFERREKIQIRRAPGRVDPVTALVDETFRSRRASREIGLVTGQSVILAEGSLEQAGPAFEGQRGPAGHTVKILFGRQVQDGKVEVLDHLLHHQFPRIAALLEEQRVAGVDRTVHPGHVAVIFHLLEIEPGPEETRQTFVFEPHVLVRAVRGVLQEKVDVAQFLPLPGIRRSGNGAVAQHLARKRGLGDDVGRFAVDRPGGGEHRVEIVGVELTLFLRAEEVIGCEPVFRETVERILATAEAARRNTGKDIKNDFFHNGSRIRKLSSDPRSRFCTRDRHSTSCPNRRPPARDRGNRSPTPTMWRDSHR